MFARVQYEFADTSISYTTSAQLTESDTSNGRQSFTALRKRPSKARSR